jgi:hypothetical protein
VETWLEVGERVASLAAHSAIRNQASGFSFYAMPNRQPKIAATAAI